MRWTTSTLHLDPNTIMYFRHNGTWVIRRLTGSRHQHVLERTGGVGGDVHEGHVLARGRIAGSNAIKVTRGELTAKAIREMLERNGYKVKVTGSRAARG